MVALWLVTVSLWCSEPLLSPKNYLRTQEELMRVCKRIPDGIWLDIMSYLAPDDPSIAFMTSFVALREGEAHRLVQDFSYASQHDPRIFFAQSSPSNSKLITKAITRVNAQKKAAALAFYAHDHAKIKEYLESECARMADASPRQQRAMVDYLIDLLQTHQKNYQESLQFTTHLTRIVTPALTIVKFIHLFLGFFIFAILHNDSSHAVKSERISCNSCICPDNRYPEEICRVSMPCNPDFCNTSESIVTTLLCIWIGLPVLGFIASKLRSLQEPTPEVMALVTNYLDRLRAVQEIMSSCASSRL